MGIIPRRRRGFPLGNSAQGLRGISSQMTSAAGFRQNFGEVAEEVESDGEFFA
jgi:hypothetical protein